MGIIPLSADHPIIDFRDLAVDVKCTELPKIHARKILFTGVATSYSTSTNRFLPRVPASNQSLPSHSTARQSLNDYSKCYPGIFAAFSPLDTPQIRYSRCMSLTSPVRWAQRRCSESLLSALGWRTAGPLQVPPPQPRHPALACSTASQRTVRSRPLALRRFPAREKAAGRRRSARFSAAATGVRLCSRPAGSRERPGLRE